MNIFSTEHPLAEQPTRVRTKIIAVSIATLLVAATALFIRHINSPRVVARGVAPDGTEFCVVQTCNWNLEFFTTSCYYRKRGGQWGWFYYDHEDWYWRRGRTEVDTTAKRMSVYRDGRVTVTFDWASERFRLLRTDFPQREITGAQQLMPVGWSITQK
jgi:hypothetical protein